MSWSIGFDDRWNRDIGYGVPSTCDHPECSEEIDRGLTYVCGSRPYGGGLGCGLYFCAKHRHFRTRQGEEVEVCGRCCAWQEPWPAKPDTLEWVAWKLTDDSWAGWRKTFPDDVAKMRERLQP